MALYHPSENKTIQYVVVMNEIQIGDGSIAAIDNIYNESLVIPSSIAEKAVTIIGKFAFSHANIGEVILPDTIITIEESAFEDIQSCQQIIFPSSIKLVNKHSFRRCSIKFVDFSKSNFQYFQGTEHFQGAKIDRLTLPPTLIEIPYAFLWGSSIKDFTFPKSLMRFDQGAFIGTYQLKTLKSESPYFVVHNNIVYSPNFRILYKYPVDTDIDILPSVVRIYAGAFSGSSFVNFSFKNKIMIIDNHAFRLCPFIRFCDLRNFKSKIVPYALFAGCGNLETVIFSSTCNEFASEIFYFCYSIKSIYFLSSIHIILGDNFISASNVNIYYCGTTQIDASVPSSTVIHVTKSFPKEINQLMNIDITSRDYECTYSNEILQFFNQYAFLCTVQQICYQQFSFWALYPIILI